ncbi:MAG: trehalase [Candidatus Riflebacteria bacterium]|nr:trehalase [Candidatus Riflebacteria bacterium]
MKKIGSFLIESILFSLFLLITTISGGSINQEVNFESSLKIEVKKNLQELLSEEDTNGDKRITIEDHFVEGDRGDRIFWITTLDGKKIKVQGTYYLSNLLQELSLFLEKGESIAVLDLKKVFENPVDRISRMIKDYYWDGLTRRVDSSNIAKLLEDEKNKTQDGRNYIYVPKWDVPAVNYFQGIIASFPDLHLTLMLVPENITPQWFESIQKKHGILSLALEKNSEGQIQGKPFVVPGGRFNEMYGWDSYFEALGLLEDGRVDLAKSMTENLAYEINMYGKILNANRTYYLTRSQPPFLTSMALAVYEKMPKSPESILWLKNMFRAAVKEYKEVWMGKKHLTDIGLSRYLDEGTGPCPEVEPGHFDYIFQIFARLYDMDPKVFEVKYRKKLIFVPALDLFFIHDRSMRESGHDKTWRWHDRCADFVTVDLNSLLYKYETDIAYAVKYTFANDFECDGVKQDFKEWFERSEQRKTLMNKYMWDEENHSFFDYDCQKGEREVYYSATAFYPLWAGLVTQDQAGLIVEKMIPLLEQAGGIVASTEESRGPISAEHPQRQWDYPYGWAPHQMIVWKALFDYGYVADSRRLAYRWLYTIVRNARDYNCTIPEKFDVEKRTHKVFAEYGNVGTNFSYITKEGFGWMNASFKKGLTMLDNRLLEKLRQLIPPEFLFQKK